MIKHAHKHTKKSDYGHRHSDKIESGHNVEKFSDHNIAAINPLSNQFEPTESAPVNQHKRMAGVG